MLDSNQVQPVISSVVTPVALEGFKTPLLNKYPGAAAAYSLRRLKSWDDGKRVVEVRRDVDGGGDTHKSFTEGEVNSGAMLAWVTEHSVTANGFVSTWYDQSGNANDATQATTTSQPKIVDAGALVTGGIDFDGVDDFLQSGSNTTHDSVFMVGARSVYQTSTLFGSTVSNTVYSFLNTSSGTSFSSGATTLSYSDTLGTSTHLHTTLHSAGKMRKDGTEKASGAIGNNTGGDSLIGARYLVGVPATFWIGTIAEIIVYATDQTANVAAIETNINNQYDIY